MIAKLSVAAEASYLYSRLQQDPPDIINERYQPPADWLTETLGKDDNSIKTY